MPFDRGQGGHWFVPKPVGYGAMPANGKGWTAIGVYAAFIVVLAMVAFLVGMPVGIAVFIVGTLVATGVLVVVAKAKTKGEWRWRSRGNGGQDASPSH